MHISSQEICDDFWKVGCENDCIVRPGRVGGLFSRIYSILGVETMARSVIIQNKRK